MILLLLSCWSNWSLKSDLDGDGYSIADGDCDDTNFGVNPGFVEVCDLLDNDCNGIIDDATGINVPIWYEDKDGDGFGNIFVARKYCPFNVPEGFVQSNSDDCDDTNPNINPEEIEICDGLDNDCNEGVDDRPQDAINWYLDADGDGFGVEDESVEVCEQPNGYVSDTGDCNDSNPSINPDAIDLCDGLDNDCDGEIDNDSVLADEYFYDLDGDGYGGASLELSNCSELEDGVVFIGGDCDDSDETIYPYSTNGIEDPVLNSIVDINCDGIVACLDVGCDGVSEIWQPQLNGLSYYMTVDDGPLQNIPFQDAKEISYSAEVPLQQDNYGRSFVVSNTNDCTGDAGTIKMWGAGPHLVNFNVQSSQTKKVVFFDSNSDSVTDALIVNGYGPNDDLSCGDPIIQFLEMELTSSTETESEMDWLPSRAVFFDTQGVDAVVGDFNMDGTPDMALCQYQNDMGQEINSTFIYSILDPATVTHSTIPISYCRGVDILHWDEDAQDDIVIASETGQYLLTSSSGYVPQLLSATPSTWVIVSDIDNNGQEDIVFGPMGISGTTINVYRNGGYSADDDINIIGCDTPEVLLLDEDIYPELVCPYSEGSPSTIFWGSGQGWSTSSKREVQTSSKSFISVGYLRHSSERAFVLSPEESASTSCVVENLSNPSDLCSEEVSLIQMNGKPQIWGWGYGL